MARASYTSRKRGAGVLARSAVLERHAIDRIDASYAAACACNCNKLFMRMQLQQLLRLPSETFLEGNAQF